MKKILLNKLSYCFLTAMFCSHIGQSQIITTVAGIGGIGYSGDGGPATAAQFNNPGNVYADAWGNYYVADMDGQRVRKVNSAGIINTIAGTGATGFTGDGGPATAARLQFPVGTVADPAGNLYISDQSNGRVRKISTSGVITTVAGSNTRGFAGDGGPATAAQLHDPLAVVTDGTNMYISDYVNNRVRKVNASGIITTYAGTTSGFGGDGGPATAARLGQPASLALDPAGNLYIADNVNNRIRMVSASGIITTVAGTGSAGFSGDGGPATAAKLNNASGICLDAAGNLYIADANNNRIRKVNTSGIISTIVGTGSAGFGGDGGPATSASIDGPIAVSVNAAGELFICDFNNGRIRRLCVSVPTVAAIAGSSSLCVGDTTILTDAVTGGSWVSSNAAVASVNAVTGKVTGVAPGHASISYALVNACGTDTATLSLTVTGPPRVTSIAGTDSICIHQAVTFTDTSAGGVWSSSNSAVATVSSTGLVYGSMAGTVNILYTVTNLCGSDTAVIRVIVKSGCPDAVEVVSSNKPTTLDLHPNPSNGKLTVLLTSATDEEFTLIITDVTGRKISQRTTTTNHPTEIQLNVPGGLYCITATTSAAAFVKKFEID